MQHFVPITEKHLFKALAKAPLKRTPIFHLFNEIGSTNSYLKSLVLPALESPHPPYLEICIAEHQTRGRGRFGRRWESPYGENIYLSCRWQAHTKLNNLSCLSLVVALAIEASLKFIVPNEDILIKWPNDLLWQHKKIAGILIETNSETKHGTELIIGIGLNVNSDNRAKPLSDKPSGSLYDMCGLLLDRNAVIARLLRSLEIYIDQYLQTGFGAFQAYYQQVDYLKDRQISVLLRDNIYTGTAQGITLEGQLLLLDEQGIEHLISSGEASLHSSYL